ncbi:MAG: sigma-54 dependent transcriptional regulator [Pyrinomonadaceae bacterium]
MANKALVIDDDKATLDLMEFQLRSEGFLVTKAENGQLGLKYIEDNEFDIILTDLQLPGLSGIEIVKRSKEISPDTEIIMVTGYGSTEKAIEATKAGAFYYIEKPVEFDELIVLIEKAIERKQQKEEIRELRGKLSKRNAYEGIIGGSRAMQEIYELIDGVAVSDANILILGESGTGKELIANAIHYTSARSNKPFVKVNCSALPKELIESELFGHKKGSFTGAIGDKEGLIGRANGGSLLLDEIGEMPLDLQPKLLRVLQERVYYRVGSEKPQEADFRLISATNRSPFEAIEVGNLREDLYYRINTIEIKIPPLRERMEDVPMLAEHFLKNFSEKYSRENIGFSEEAYDQMLNYDWRGNVRELENVLERAVLLSKTGKISQLNIPKNYNSKITFSDIQKSKPVESAGNEALNAVAVSGVANGTSNGGHMALSTELSGEDMFDAVGKFIVERLPEPKTSDNLDDVFNSIESSVVLAALKRTKGNKQAAANLLGLYRPRLYGMIKRHNLDGKMGN